jgi:hypothetical protein
MNTCSICQKDFHDGAGWQHHLDWHQRERLKAKEGLCTTKFRNKIAHLLATNGSNPDNKTTLMRKKKNEENRIQNPPV